MLRPNFLLSISFILILCCISGCQKMKNKEEQFLSTQLPASQPVSFMEELTPDDQLIHKGTFSPDLSEYYYTLSDQQFERFDVYVIRKLADSSSVPEPAFFNSNYSDHGMSFSPDGNTLYFSSTRPVNSAEIPQTWHIWKSEKEQGQWSPPEFVDIPNLKDKLVSHPTISNQGTLYFHVSSLDYAEMDLFFSKQVNGRFEPAQRVQIDMKAPLGKCTPFIAPDESYLIFATIGNQLDLYLAHRNDMGQWTQPIKLNDDINHQGQGNPYVTPENKYLFYTTGTMQDPWQVKWVNIEGLIAR